ncbi:hypothetical protein [Spiroplasma eriocheiris]|uniref:Uncharacterized protein n=1 Tax=Spiroplasma eriocheiris TaxID=315358 RepID=A0A0H3XKM6_9MOLU|nr:hypothetical protein [Spiroplasma eriocheiris]AHF57528.1 hypothetical protein SPE_0399 [Spiroplasma eriocheiris CCTCC M 207170]AKM53984.1 hypothetical protein SERIO_v1c04050 [Spiroplasma eriocheiris]
MSSQIIVGEVNDPSIEKDVLNNLGKENPNLKINQILVKDYNKSEAKIVVKPDSTVYIPGDSLMVYFNTGGKKLLSQDLIEPNIGNIVNNKSETISKALVAKNKDLKIEEIELLSITSSTAKVTAKKDSKIYVSDNVEPIEIYFQVYNPNIGKIKKQTAHFDMTNLGGVWTDYTKLAELKDSTILLNLGKKIVELNRDGSFKKDFIDVPESNITFYKIVQLLDGKIYVFAGNFNNLLIYSLELSGSIPKLILLKKFSGPDKILYFFPLSNGQFLAASGKYIYIFDFDWTLKKTYDFYETSNDGGKVIGFLLINKNPNFGDLIKIATESNIYSWEIGSDNFKLLSQTATLVQTIAQLDDGTILAFNYGSHQILQLNDDGTIRIVVANMLESYAAGFFETSDHKLFFSVVSADINHLYLYELNNK